MIKKERESLERAETAARINRALRWSDATEIEPDVLVPTDSCVTFGWLFYAGGDRVEQKWSEATVHGSVPYSKDHSLRFASRRGHALYSTKVLALRALRCAVERECAKRLAAIDAQIEAEAGEEGTKP